MDESTRTEILNALAELRKLEGSRTNFLPGEEITGEFLGEMKSIEQGVAAWLGSGSIAGARVSGDPAEQRS